MLVKSQVKFWVFGAVGAVGLYFVVTIMFGQQVGFGITLMATAFGAIILGLAWDVEKYGEKATTYLREARDEEARQALMNVMAKGAKQLEAPSQKPTKQSTHGE